MAASMRESRLESQIQFHGTTTLNLQEAHRLASQSRYSILYVSNACMCHGKQKDVASFA